jgi:hypothetical protein
MEVKLGKWEPMSGSCPRKPHENMVVSNNVNDTQCGRAIGARGLGIVTYHFLIYNSPGKLEIREMTVEELRKHLADIPDDSEIMIKHSLIGDEHSAETVEYDKKKNILWIYEVAD